MSDCLDFVKKLARKVFSFSRVALLQFIQFSQWSWNNFLLELILFENEIMSIIAFYNTPNN